MKKIATLLLAAGLLFSAAGMAQAIDFKIRGQWIMAFDYGEHGAFTGGNGMTGYKKGNEDNFEARQRLRLQLDAVASENLSGSVIFEMGDRSGARAPPAVPWAPTARWWKSRTPGWTGWCRIPTSRSAWACRAFSCPA